MKKTSSSDRSSSESAKVDGYIRKHKAWADTLEALRALALEAKLTETIKWRAPCYMHAGSNVIIIGAAKDHCVLSFLKGSLLKDEKGLLEKPGENSQAARVMRFENADEVAKHQASIRRLLKEAMKLEDEGRKVAFKKSPEPRPPELEEVLARDAALAAAFDALTPGRQRGYIIHFTGAKQSATRLARIEKCRDMILAGKGMHDDYREKIKRVK